MDEVDEIKRRIDIVDLISSYLTLKKAGSNYKALCPFHQEKTPSFMVSPERQIFKCFGCSEGGDIFTFTMKMENLGFREALVMLAERAGVKLPEYRRHLAAGKAGRTEDGKDQRDVKSKLYRINALSTKVFHKILMAHPSGKPALDYLLKKRKLTLETVKEFLIGYAPSSQALFKYLKNRGFSQSDLQNAGSPERFFRRIIFPIRDVMGNTIAFTGRVLDPKQEPKYLNTPETVIFKKSRVLYNLDQARGEIKRQKAAVVVEGQMDVIASFQAGVRNIVATSGTALTYDHLQILSRYSPNVIFAFDADTAGLQTAKKAYEMAIQAGLNVKMVNLGDFKDPGEMIARNPAFWRQAVDQATSVIDWYFGLAFSKQLTANGDKELTSQEKKEIAKEILPIIKKIPDSIEQAHYVGLLAKRLSVSERVVFDALTKIGAPSSKEMTSSRPAKRLTIEEIFIAIFLKNPGKVFESLKKNKEISLKDPSLSAIYKTALLLYNQERDREKFLKSLREGLPRQLGLKIDELLFLANEQTEEVSEEDLPQILAKLQTNQREALKDHYAQAIRQAESDKDHERLKKLIKEFQDEISK